MTLLKKAKEIRERTVQLHAAAGQPGESAPLACIETLVALYYNVLDVRPKAPTWSDRDRFIMGDRASRAAYYAMLADRGYFSREELDEAWAAEQAEPSAAVWLRGVDAVVNCPGEGMAVAVDTALKARADIKIYRTVLLVSQEDCLTGALWENALRASENMLEDLTVILVRPMAELLPGMDNICAKFSAFGFDTFSVDGSSIEAVTVAMELPRRSSKPRFICCDV